MIPPPPLRYPTRSGDFATFYGLSLQKITTRYLILHPELLQVPTKRARREHVPYYLLRLTAPDGHYQHLHRGQITDERVRDDMTATTIGTTTIRLHCDGERLLPVEHRLSPLLRLCDKLHREREHEYTEHDMQNAGTGTGTSHPVPYSTRSTLTLLFQRKHLPTPDTFP